MATDKMHAPVAGGAGTLAVILAAGEGTRMRSARPKVLHEVAGRPMIRHVLDAATAAGVAQLAVVVGPGRQDVGDLARASVPGIAVHEQRERRGTAHAVLAAQATLARLYDHSVIVLFGDTPLVTAPTIRHMLDLAQTLQGVVTLGMRPADPHGYGRLITDGTDLLAIVEHKDATEAQRAVGFCNAGLMAFGPGVALGVLAAIDDRNAQQEFYLTDAVAVARRQGLRVAAIEAAETEVMGINDRVQLARAEAIMQGRLREVAMRAGATFVQPDTVTLQADTVFGRDVLVEPHVVFGSGVSVGDGAVIKAFSHIEGARIGEAAQIGPFARLRPGTEIGAKARVGNFVETKAARLGRGAKANHLSYIGDAEVGDEANIGAGTITCNYDGFAKHHTSIGAGAFIGSNSALVAPVAVGAGAIVGAGSTVTRDVPADALAVVRGEQRTLPDGAARFRAARRMKRSKAHA